MQRPLDVDPDCVVQLMLVMVFMAGLSLVRPAIRRL
jgi:hypothetical protein